jgi:lysophospholipase L1-like esterase
LKELPEMAGICGIRWPLVVLNLFLAVCVMPVEVATHAVVVLGDSTMSGEGAGSYLPGTDGEHDDWCHRSLDASVNHVTVPADTRVFNLACSGTGTDSIRLDTPPGAEPSQAAQLRAIASKYRITTVAVAVGANDDPQFGPLLDQCARELFLDRGPGCGQQVDKQWPVRVAGAVPKIVKALGDVRKVMTENGYTDGAYSLVLQSYADPVPADVGKSLQNLNGCPFRAEDLRWVHDRGVPQLNEGIRQAAKLAGARFLDLSKAGAGHEACSGGDEWFTRLSVNWHDLQDDTRYNHALQSSFHPNARGYTAFGQCLTRFLATDGSAAACVSDGHGGLQLRHTGD